MSLNQLLGQPGGLQLDLDRRDAISPGHRQVIADGEHDGGHGLHVVEDVGGVHPSAGTI